MYVGCLSYWFNKFPCIDKKQVNLGSVMHEHE